MTKQDLEWRKLDRSPFLSSKVLIALGFEKTHIYFFGNNTYFFINILEEFFNPQKEQIRGKVTSCSSMVRKQLKAFQSPNKECKMSPPFWIFNSNIVSLSSISFFWSCIKWFFCYHYFEKKPFEILSQNYLLEKRSNN